MFRLFFGNKQCYFYPRVLLERFGQLLPYCSSLFLHTYMKDSRLEDLKGVMSGFVFNVFKEEGGGICLFRDDVEVKA